MDIVTAAATANGVRCVHSLKAYKMMMFMEHVNKDLVPCMFSSAAVSLVSWSESDSSRSKRELQLQTL